jgi:putative membrane protein
MYKLIAAVAAVLAICAIPAVAAGDRSPGHDGRHGSRVSPISAEEFLTAAAAGNRFEITTGQLAQQRAASAEVKSLGGEFVTHHTALLQQGNAVAATLAITVPETLTPDQQRTVALLQRLSGKAFDRAWLAAQLKAHRQALVLHLRAAIRGDQPAVRTLAQGALPVITHHLGELLDLAEAARADGGHHGDSRHEGPGHGRD